jgi:hypothetical protein
VLLDAENRDDQAEQQARSWIVQVAFMQPDAQQKWVAKMDPSVIAGAIIRMICSLSSYSGAVLASRAGQK